MFDYLALGHYCMLLLIVICMYERNLQYALIRFCLFYAMNDGITVCEGLFEVLSFSVHCDRENVFLCLILSRFSYYLNIF